ncbi:Uncharacterised protein [Klebsiella pneumoniae]|nr:Uncharacterised protein [Klebsiella pneumoniae]
MVRQKCSGIRRSYLVDQEDHLLQEFLLALLSRSHLVTVLLLPCRMNLSIRNSIP